MNATAPTLDARTRMGAVRLRVADLEGVRRFYERAVGLETLGSSASGAALGVGGEALVELIAAPAAPPRPRRTTGLFHLAILVPDRARLGAALRRMTEAGWRLTGASDHLVSEALYTSDPEGNGIEIYRDRAREEWPRAGGQVQMDTLPLDLPSLLAEPDPGEPPAMAPGTAIGHVHLNVGDLPDAEAFYAGVVGFEVTVRGYPGALFVSAGGYHHHLGLNTWAGEAATAPPPGGLGLERFEIVVPGGADLQAASERLRAAGVEVEHDGGAIAFADPFGNGVALRASRTAGQGAPPAPSE
jgi:catechol 2,3-dioxygenase